MVSLDLQITKGGCGGSVTNCSDRERASASHACSDISYLTLDHLAHVRFPLVAIAFHYQ